MVQVINPVGTRTFWVFQMQHALEDLPELEDTTPAGFTRQDPLLKPIP